ncbi:T9SS type A sorting domain-containing protein, partial [Reichenbachiella versicolor]|uniref:T9SS type A sorting domain-containing protein n=1 Tax=Reichenbachiella versicolor TaxID=1821036 RepID=UPI0013A5BCFD
SSTDSSPLAFKAGTYKVVVTHPESGCTDSKTIEVEYDESKPSDIVVSVSGDLSCIVDEVTLSASSTTSGATYSWEGPEGYSSTDSSPLAFKAGTYKVVVTHPESGCTDSKTIEVGEDKNAPDLTIAEEVYHTCITDASGGLILSPTSTIADLTYEWKVPDGHDLFLGSLDEQNLKVKLSSLTGTYEVTATNPSNGCKTTETVEVEDGLTKPDIVLSVNGDLTCVTDEVTLGVSSTTTGVTYSWTGPEGYSSTDSSPLAFKAGTYEVVATHPVSGCTVTEDIKVGEDKDGPDLTIAEEVYHTCITDAAGGLILSPTSTIADLTYEWKVPDGHDLFLGKLDEQNLEVKFSTLTGTYEVTATNPSNGCKTTETVEVESDLVGPNVELSVDGLITCSNQELTIDLTTDLGEEEVSFAWTGPGGFETSIEDPEVTESGTYKVKVTNLLNGCSVDPTVTVREDKIAPDVNITGGGTITCVVDEVGVSASSSVVGVSYSWTGPGSFSSSNSDFTTSEKGTYEVTIQNPTNGCTNKDDITVEEDKAIPDLAIEDANHTCYTVEAGGLVLSPTTTTTDLTYEWTIPVPGTEFFHSPLDKKDLTITQSFIVGEYSVKATSTINGCSNSVSLEVGNNTAKPSCLIAENGNLLSVSELSNGEYTWTIDNSDWSIDSGAGTSEITISRGPVGSTARVIVEILDLDNGCSESCFIDLTSTASVASRLATTSKNSNVVVNDAPEEVLEHEMVPNPFRDKGKIVFEPDHDSKVTIKLFDLNGNGVGTVFEEYVLEGQTYEAEIDTQNMDSGVYIYYIITDNHVYDGRIMLVK